MSVQARSCNPDRIEAFLDRRLNDSEQALLEEHLSECSSCRESLAARTAEDELWDKARLYLRDDEGAEDRLPETNISPGDHHQAPSIQQVLDSLQPTDDPQMLGRIGGYEVIGVVGAGGMGVVLKALDKSLERTVAIKVLAPHLASSGPARKRFAREAKAAAAVLHSNVVAIHGVSNGEPLPYLVMPYVRGQSLQRRIDQEGPLPLGETLRIGSQIAAGLAAAHAQGLVHRDITPANILLEDGVERVAITDFGLARAVDDATMTQSGVITGTPQYMSPEQAKGEAIDHRSDLFSLGSVLYFMCAGHSPFRAEGTVGVLRRISDETPRPVCEINSEIPDWLEAIIGKLLAKQPDLRFQSAAETADLLGQWLAHLQQPVTAPRPRPVAPPPGSDKRNGDRRRYRVTRWLIGFATAAMLLMATVFLVRLGETTIRFQIDDPNIAVHFGDKTISLDNDGEKIHITPGEKNTFIISKENGTEVVGSSLQLKQGQKVVLRVSTAANGEIQIFSDPFDLPPPAMFTIGDRGSESDSETEETDRPSVAEVLDHIRSATVKRNEQLGRSSVRVLSSRQTLPELTVRMLYIKRDWPSGESDRLRDEMLTAAGKRELDPALQQALAAEENIGPHDFFPCIEQAAIFDPEDFECLLGWLREHDLLAKETVRPKEISHVARWRKTIDHNTAAGFGAGVSSLGVSIGRPERPDSVARIKIHLTRAAALDSKIPPRLSGKIKTYDPVSLSLPNNRVAAFRWYPDFSDVREDSNGDPRRIEPIFVFHQRRAASAQKATSGECRFPERVVRLAIEPDLPPQTPPAPVSNNTEESDDVRSLEEVVRQIPPGENTPFRRSLNSHAIDDWLARDEYKLRLADRKQRSIYLDAVRRVWYATEKRRRLLNSFSVKATSSTTDEETHNEGSWEGTLLIKDELARSERTWSGIGGETDTAIRTNDFDFALNNIRKKLEAHRRKRFDRSATLFQIRREGVKPAAFVPDPRDLAVPHFYNESRITAELGELGSIPCLRLEEVRSTPGKRLRIVHFVDPNQEAILLRREIHALDSNKWTVFEFDWKFHEDFGCHIITTHSEKRYRQDHPTAVAYWRRTIEYRDYKAEDYPDSRFDIDELRERVGVAQHAPTAARDAKTAVIRITTRLGVEKTMPVESCLAIGEPKWDPCVIARSRSATAARDFLILRTDEPIYFRIPIRLISQVNARDNGHVVELASGKQLTGKLACFINGYDLTNVQKLVVIAARGSSQLTSRALRSDRRWRLNIDSADKLEFIVQSARWAYTPTKKNEEEYEIAETPIFHVMVDGQRYQARVDDFRVLSTAEGEGGGDTGISLTAPGGKPLVGSLRVGDHSNAERIALFAETLDGILVTLSHDSPDWTLTVQP